jgi:hypothetical protein
LLGDYFKFRLVCQGVSNLKNFIANHQVLAAVGETQAFTQMPKLHWDSSFLDTHSHRASPHSRQGKHFGDVAKIN